MEFRFFFVLILFFCVTNVLNAQKTAGDPLLKKARSVTNKNIISCSSEKGKGEDFFAPQGAVTSLEKGMTLQMAETELSDADVMADDVILELFPGADPERNDVSLTLKGDNTTLRGLKFRNLTVSKNTTIVDCVIDYLQILGEQGKKKTRVNIINSVIGKITVNDDAENRNYKKGTAKNFTIPDITFRNCVLGMHSTFFRQISGNRGTDNPETVFSVYAKADITVSNSIIYSDRLFMLGTQFIEQKGKIWLADSLIYGKTHIAETPDPNAKRGETNKSISVKNMLDLKKQFGRSIGVRQNVVNDAPEFESIDIVRQESHKNDSGRNKTSYSFDYAKLQLKKDSPGANIKGIGILEFNKSSFPGIDN